jgi:molybdopterin/thiamine biosynthesis adenylyltransferase
MPNIAAFVHKHSTEGLLPWAVQSVAAEKFDRSPAEIEEIALQNGILPARYQRNRTMISISDQLLLFRSRIAVIGCGGLGGYIIEQLARLGIGHIVAIDPDVFDEHNLNRQLFATIGNLGQAKVEAVITRVSQINPAVTVTPLKEIFCTANSREILKGVTVAVDALDCISCRLELANSCTEMKIPMVHGAIGGWYGHVATQFAGDTTVQSIYSNWVNGKGIENELGNPSFTPAVVAGLQVAEVCKIVLGKGELLRRRELIIDLLDMEVHEIQFGGPSNKTTFLEKQ